MFEDSQIISILMSICRTKGLPHIYPSDGIFKWHSDNISMVEGLLSPLKMPLC